MNRQILPFIFFLITCSGYIRGQDLKFSNAKPSITKFYEYIYQDSSKSTSDLLKIFESPINAYHFKEIKEHYSGDLTQGLKFENLKLVIDNIGIHYDGDINTQYAILQFPNKKNIYFELNADSVFQENYPAQIEDIFLSTGNSIISFDSNEVPERLLFLGLINPKRNKSSSKKNLKVNQLFYFSPNESEWYEIFNYQDQKSIGFIKKDDIITFEEFSKPIKNKILKKGF